MGLGRSFRNSRGYLEVIFCSCSLVTSAGGALLAAKDIKAQATLVKQAAMVSLVIWIWMWLGLWFYGEPAIKRFLVALLFSSAILLGTIKAAGLASDSSKKINGCTHVQVMYIQEK